LRCWSSLLLALLVHMMAVRDCCRARRPRRTSPDSSSRPPPESSRDGRRRRTATRRAAAGGPAPRGEGMRPLPPPPRPMIGPGLTHRVPRSLPPPSLAPRQLAYNWQSPWDRRATKDRAVRRRGLSSTGARIIRCSWCRYAWSFIGVYNFESPVTREISLASQPSQGASSFEATDPEPARPAPGAGGAAGDPAAGRAAKRDRRRR
jgi:hypothetical protein